MVISIIEVYLYEELKWCNWETLQWSCMWWER